MFIRILFAVNGIKIIQTICHLKKFILLRYNVTIYSDNLCYTLINEKKDTCNWRRWVCRK
jgi:hypothetical protein